MDSMEEFLQVGTDHPGVTSRKIQLCLGHCVMRRSSRSKSIAVIGERWVPPPLQNLHHRLLEKSIERSWDTKLSHPPSARLLAFHPPYPLRYIGPPPHFFPYAH